MDSQPGAGATSQEDSIRWGGSVTERVEDAGRVAADVLQFVRVGDLVEASRQLALVERLVGQNAQGDVGRSIADLLAEIYAAGADAAGRLDVPLRAEYLHARVVAASDEEQVGLLRRLKELAVGERARGRTEAWVDVVELDLGLVLGRVGRTQEAIEVLRELEERLRGKPSPDSNWIEFEAGYAAFYYLNAAGREAEAVRACERLIARWLSDQSLSVVRKERLSGAMWMRCTALSRAAIEQTGRVDDGALRALDQLLDWLRSQTAPPLRAELARRLAIKAQLARFGDAELDVLEELISVLAGVDDSATVVEIADGVLAKTPWIVAATPDDNRRLQDAVPAGVERGQGLGPDETGVSDASITRAQRLVSVLHALAGRLGKSPGDRATELRSEALLGSLAPLATLGRIDEQQALLEELAEIGQPALQACDTILARLSERPAFNSLSLSVPMFKAGILFSNDEPDAAASTLQELIEAFGDREEPWIATVVNRARDLVHDAEDGS